MSEKKKQQPLGNSNEEAPHYYCNNQNITGSNNLVSCSDLPENKPRLCQLVCLEKTETSIVAYSKKEAQQLISQLINNPNTLEIIEGLTWLFDDSIEKIGSWLCSENKSLGAKPIDLIYQEKHHLVADEVNMMIVRDWDQI